MQEKQHTAPVAVVAASYLGPSLSPNEDSPWEEARLPLNCDPLVQKVMGQLMRRAGRFIKMVCAGAIACLNQVPSGTLDGKKTGIFLATGLGNGDEILPFVTQVFKHDGGFPSPNQFANSVSNAAAFFLARSCGIRGIILTVSDEELSFESALWLAQSYLESGELDYALVGGCDVYTPTVEEYRQRMNALAENSRALPIGEGSSWLLLGAREENRIGNLLTVRMNSEKMTPGQYTKSDEFASLCSSASGAKERIWLPGFRLKNPDAPEGMRAQDYLRHCGIYPTASAFGLAYAMRHHQASVMMHYNCSDSGKPAIIVATST